MNADLEFNYEETTAAMEKFSQKDIEELRRWTRELDKSKCVPKDLTDKQIVLFYNACDSDIKKTQVCIESYYSCRKSTPEFFNKRGLNEDLNKAFKIFEASVFPNKSIEGYDIIFQRLVDNDTSKFCISSGLKLLFMTVDLCMSKRGPQPGVIFLFDMAGFRFGHLLRLNISSLRKFFWYIQDAIPVRMKAIHVLNAEPIIDKVLSLVRPFMNKKFADMINIHMRTESLEKFHEEVIPKSSLPANYEGTLPDTKVLHELCMEQHELLQTYFKAEEEQRLKASSS